MDILFCSITPTNLGQLSKPGTDLKTAGPDVFKTPPTCTIWPSFAWDIWGKRQMISFLKFPVISTFNPVYSYITFVNFF